MANENQNTSSVNPGPLLKGMVKDTDDSYTPQGAWFHARNATPYSRDGNLGALSNESSTRLCLILNYTLNGAIHLYKDVWAIFSTDNVHSEIGVFEEGTCIYTPLKNCNGATMNPVNCLNFKTTNLIVGVSKENFDCSFQVYFADKLNPDRTVNITKPQFVEICKDEANVTLPGPPNYITVGCITCVCTTDIDCNAILLSSLVKVPCLSVSRGPSGGNILNGSYYVVAAYVVNDQRVTDYYTPSNTQAIFEHANSAGSLLITVEHIDKENFDWFELVVVSTVNQQTSARRIGTYSTQQAQISIDYINNALPSIPVEFLPIRSPKYERSDGIFETGQYMIRVGPRAKFDFNYQPLANRIRTQWQAIAYPSDYYAKGGNKTGHMRDEVYPFFIRWIYDTGEKSSSYHIPGRPRRLVSAGPPAVYENSISGNTNALDATDKDFEVFNRATGNYAAATIGTPSNGGLLIAQGEMGYWESTEKYPDKDPIMYNASGFKDVTAAVPSNAWATITPITNPYPNTAISEYDLCGEQIRHHKFPDNTIIPHFRTTPGTLNTPNESEQIIVLGVAFDNIVPPLDNDGNLIPGIVGYEMLRGSREGNKTVIAKGIINNMRTYNLDTLDSSGLPVKGLYQSYPFNDLNPDPFLTDIENQGDPALFGDHGPAANTPSFDKFTFHSPDTSFNTPYLSAKELHLYGVTSGKVIGNFSESPEHPKEKLVTDLTLIISAILGIGTAILAIRGQKTERTTYPQMLSVGESGSFAGPGGIASWSSPSSTPLPTALAQIAANSGFFLAANVAYTGAKSADSANSLGVALAKMFSNIDTAEQGSFPNSYAGLSLLPGFLGQSTERSVQESPSGNIPTPVSIFSGLGMYSSYWSQGTEVALDLIRTLVPYTQFAMRYTAIGFMNRLAPPPTSFRFNIRDSLYLRDGWQNFGPKNELRINNVDRSNTVVIEVDPSKPVLPTVGDNTLQSIGTTNTIQFRRSSLGFDTAQNDFSPNNVKLGFNTNAVSYYTGLKVRMRNQYGQLNGIIQIPLSTCDVPINPPVIGVPVTQFGTAISGTGPILNGDIYVGRYTEKNTFFYFYDWLYGQPEGFEFNYKTRYMLNYPRYWANFTKFDIGPLLQSIAVAPVALVTGVQNPIQLPSAYHSLDGATTATGFFNLFNSIFRVHNEYFYLFNSSIRDFFVESEINISLRDWEDPVERRYYDPARFADTNALFDPKIIKSGNFFKYDQSLSISRIFNNFIPWGNIQQSDYNPAIAETCYSYYRNRLIYSLPQQREARKDFWKVFLANDYKDFKNRITAVKPINQTGAMIFFPTASPQLFQGVDELRTDLGVKITIGDGELFRRDPKSIVNMDTSYEFASCQDRLSIINTKYGLFWISQDQGKIFSYGDSLDEVSKSGLWFWLATYLPYRLTDDFPTFDILDNPVAGIGCQTIYDNQEDLLYFCKKDYTLNPQYKGQVTYTPGTGFQIGTLSIQLGNPTYFDDASWTLSYNPKQKMWISFHDWHPDLAIAGKNEFLTAVHNHTTQHGSIWRHNARTDSFCNFYGVDYPFEIDRIAQTASMVNTLRSVEYYMEAYIYKGATNDIYEVLNANFDHATIYNREQVSGTLILNQTPPNNIAGSLLYPIINPTSIDILADKVEQKYRFNQFWDITADRGEFTFPNVQRPIWITHPNGYIRDLNPANLNYQKNPFQQKKFRHYANHLRLYKNISANINYVVKLINAKELASFR